MAKRLTDTDKWKDDWYVSLSNDYRIIWQWLLDNCNHAAICKRSMGILNMMCKTNILEDDLIRVMDGRVIIAQNNWFIPNFLKFQYSGLQSDKPVIVSVRNELQRTGYYTMIPQSFGNDYIIIKNTNTDTDTDTVKDKYRKGGVGENQKNGLERDVGGWNTKPGSEAMNLELDPVKGEAVIQMFSMSKNQDITQNDLDALWQVFKKQNFNGETYYQSKNKVFTHFINWAKNQKIKNGKSGTKSSGRTIELDKP